MYAVIVTYLNTLPRISLSESELLESGGRKRPFNWRIVDHIRIGLDMNKALSRYAPRGESLAVNKETIEQINLDGEERRIWWTEYLVELEEELYAT